MRGGHHTHLVCSLAAWRRPGRSNNFTGISLDLSNRNLLEGNDCFNNDTGIYLQHANDNILRKNDCTGGTWGMRLYADADTPIKGNRLIENFCYDNGSQGCYIKCGIDNSLIRNTILMCGGLAVRLDASSGNYLWLNNLMSSADRHVLSSSTDYWNSPVPLWYTYGGETRTSFVGNYYDDHDLYDGNGNGVADTPYLLPGDEPDDGYPLAKWSRHGDWDWNVVSSGDETISASGSRVVASSLSITAGAVTVDGGFLAIGGLW